MARRTSYLVAGILFLFVAALAFIAVLGALAGSSTGSPDVGLATFSAVCGTLLGLFGLGALLVYRQGARHDARFSTVVAVLEHVTEVTAADVARTIRSTADEAAALIVEAIQYGRVSGTFEPRTGRFVRVVPGLFQPPRAPSAAMPPADAMEIRFCRECGGHIERMANGSGLRCPNCGHEEMG